MSASAPTDTVVLVHGLWMTAPGWEAVADYALEWGAKHARTTART